MFFTTKLDQVNVADSAFLIFECWTHRMNQTHGATLSEVSAEYPIHMDYEGESAQALERVFCRHSFKLFGKAHTVPDEKLNTSKKMTRKGGSRKNYNSRQVRWMGRNHYADI